MLLHLPVRDDARAGVLERLAAGDVVVVVMAVDQIFDRLIGHLLDFVDIGLTTSRAAIGNRIGGDHARLGDDEHRLMIAVTKDVDVVSAFDLGGGEGRSLLLRKRPNGCCKHADCHDHQTHRESPNYRPWLIDTTAAWYSAMGTIAEGAI